MKQNICLKYKPKFLGVNYHQGYHKMFKNQLCYKVCTVIKSSEVKTIKVRNRRQISKSAKAIRIYQFKFCD